MLKFDSKVKEINDDHVILEVVIDKFCKGTQTPVVQLRKFTKEKFGQLQPEVGQFLVIRFNENPTIFRDIVTTKRDISKLFGHNIHFNGTHITYRLNESNE